MNKPKRYLAFLAYLLSFIGGLYVLLFHREEKLARYHAKQSLGLAAFAIGAPLVWAVVGWAVSWIPLVGPIVAASLFALVIVTYVALVALWIVGMIRALRAEMRPLPVIGEWVGRVPIR
jgi:uncharacterized membrane protein